MPRTPHRRRTPADRIAALCGALLFALHGLVATEAHAAPGDVLFTDGFETGFAKWSTTNTSLSGINTMTWSSSSRSLFVRGATVATTSIAIDARVPALRVRAWIRRGSDAFSEQPDVGEDLWLEYLDSSGSWIRLASWSGSGTAGAIFSLDQTIGGLALHAGFRLRVRLLRGSGGPPDNRGIGWDFWHVDDVVVSEAMPSTGLALGRCEEFSGGLTGWTVAPGVGQARATSQAVNTASQSLAINGGTVTVTSQTVDLARLRDAKLDLWLRRGSDAFSEDPDVGEDFYVEYLNGSARWTRLATYPGDGAVGEIVRPSFSLPGSALHTGFRVRFGMTGRDGSDWDYWHVDSVCLSTRSPIAEWRFEESAYRGVADEVKDATDSGYHGTAYGQARPTLIESALPGDPGSCSHAAFDGDGDGDGVAIPGRSGLDRSSALTYSIWMQPHTSTGTRYVLGTNVDTSRSDRSQMAIYTVDGALIGSAITRAGTYSIKAALPPVKTWSHVALAFDGKSLVLSVNASAVARADFAETTLVEGGRELGIGNIPTTRNAGFLGYLDEARVDAAALDATRLGEVMKETHDCAAVPLRFVIQHDGSGAHCQPETMRVLVRDVLGSSVTTYGGTITLDTQTKTGSWSLVRGDGLLRDATPNDGLATYRFAASDLGEASFALHYATGPTSVDVDVYDAGSRDDDSEGWLVFAPSSFQLTANAIPTPPPNSIDDPLGTRTAGSAFDLHVTAFGGASGGVACGVIDSYDGEKVLRLWAEPLDPSVTPLVPTVDGQPLATSEAAAGKQLVWFRQGRALVSVKYKDTGRLALHALDAASATPIRGSSGSFVSVPADLRIVAVENEAGDPNPGTIEPDGKLFARAGEPFRVTVDALDAEGDRTPSFGRESQPEGLLLSSTALVAPSGGRNGGGDEGLIENGTAFSPDAFAGRFLGKAFAFDEVGAIRLRASVADGDFLGAGPVLGSETDPVGRFAPSHFEVAVNAPRFATTCPVGAFSWLGQPFRFDAGFEPTVVVTALSRGGSRTANYMGDWFRLSHATLSGRRYRANGATVDESGLPSTQADPSIVSNNDGSATLTFSSGSGLVLTRGSPVAPFDAELELSLDIVDADETTYPDNTVRIGGIGAGTGIAFAPSKRFQFGRLRLDNAFGSELVALPMRLRVQRFDGTSFDDDDSDSCTQVPASALVRTASPTDLASKPDIGHVPLFAGDAGLVWSAPRASGTVDVRVDLGSTGANLPWLRADWPEDGNLDGVLDDDPRARATFGIWEGRDALIFVRELY
jgi:hypothetical protein